MLPFGLVLGVAINDSIMPRAVGWATSWLIFAGAAQLATVSLAATSTWLALVATAAVINLRHLMYGAAISPRFADQPRWFRWIGPYLLVDQVFAITIPRTDLDASAFRRFYLAVGFFFWTCWNVTVSLGMVVGEAIPPEWRLDVAPAVMFCGLVVIGATSRPAVIAAVSAAAVTVVALPLPNNLGLLVGAAAGLVAGAAADRDETNLGTAPEVPPAGPVPSREDRGR